jgi:NADPH:quinone reductase-like Zn-dependent oxidoreductase
MFRTGHHFAVPVFPQAQGLEAAGLWMSYATAYGALIDIADLHLGDVMAIPAESSSVGLAAVQIANLIGGRPIALSRTAGKHDQLLAAGAPR